MRMLVYDAAICCTRLCCLVLCVQSDGEDRRKAESTGPHALTTDPTFQSTGAEKCHSGGINSVNCSGHQLCRLAGWLAGRQTHNGPPCADHGGHGGIQCRRSRRRRRRSVIVIVSVDVGSSDEQ